MKDETKCLHSGYSPKNSEPRVMPIVQSTTYVYDSTEEVGKANEALEKGIADARKLLEELQKQLAALNPVLAKSLRRRRLARRRLQGQQAYRGNQHDSSHLGLCLVFSLNSKLT